MDIPLIPLLLHIVIGVITTPSQADFGSRLLMFHVKRLEYNESMFYEFNCSSSRQSIGHSAEFIIDGQTVEHILVHNNKCFNSKNEECTTDNCQCFPSDNVYIHKYKDINQHAEKVIGCQMRFVDNKSGDVIKAALSIWINETAIRMHAYHVKKLTQHEVKNSDEEISTSLEEGITKWLPALFGLLPLIIVCLMIVIWFIYRSKYKNRKHEARIDKEYIHGNANETHELENLLSNDETSQDAVKRKSISAIEDNPECMHEHPECIEAEVKQQDEYQIPKHIQAQHEYEIREWEQEQTSFVATRATHHILGSLPFDNCILVTGCLGCGKSSNIHHAALHLRDNFGYEIIPVFTGPTDIINYYNENKKQVFIVDDIYGKETININSLQMWKEYFEKNEKRFKITDKHVAHKNSGTVSQISSPKLLISCRLHIYKESQFHLITVFTIKECNLSSSKLCLLQGERMLILQKYLPDDIITNVDQGILNLDFLPLLCKLSTDKTPEEIMKLFKVPLNIIKKDITHLTDNKAHLCALTLCILFDGGFNTEWLHLRSVSEKTKDKLEYIVQEFDINLSKETSINFLKSGFSTLDGTYLKRIGMKYKIIHHKIYSIAAVICGQHLLECFIKHAPSVLIRDYFIFESLTEIRENGDLIVLLKNQEEDYFQRLLCDLKEHVITSTFHNKQLIYQSFMEKLIIFFDRNDDVKTVLKVLNNSGCVTKTPLIESASRGYLDIVHFLICNVKCNVNEIDREGICPLYKASECGYLVIVKLLLDNNANVSQCNNHRESPLSVACKAGYKDIVELLLQHNADVSQCNIGSESPLFLACNGGYKDIVDLLLHVNNAVVSKCNINGESPLCVACKGGYTVIVEMLLQNNADVSQCSISGESPLSVACKAGYKDIVELLLQNNANVFQCNTCGESPLFLACNGGYTVIVELLLQNNADVSQCSISRESPLSVACKAGYQDIVKLLLQNNANVLQCDKCGESPLFLACNGGYKVIVELLLQKNYEISQSNISGDSSLFLACNGGYTDIVEVLLHENNTVVSQCNIRGESPLWVSCKGGYKDIVELLLQNNADISQCSISGESPLFLACNGGYTDIVELLLQNNADVSQCNNYGESPLYMACKGGYYNIVQLLLQNNADVSHCNSIGESPLFVVCKGVSEEHIHTVQLLLQNNADVLKCNKYGESPLFVACKRGCKDTVELLLHNNANVFKCNKRGDSPLFVASAEGAGEHIDTVKLLLQNNADVYKCNNYGESPLYVACKGGCKDIVELLLQHNADISYYNISGESPLFLACKGGHLDIVKLLLQKNANVCHCNISGESPLFVVCKGGNYDTAQLLLQNNADVSQCNNYGESPLYMACKGGYYDTVQLLLQNNADVSQCNIIGESPLFVACKGVSEEHIHTVQLLLQSNADVFKCNMYKESPLFVACKGGCKDTVELLLQNNAGVDQCNIIDESPLLVASVGEYKEIVDMLFQNDIKCLLVR